MKLDELIAAERAAPRESTPDEADRVWKNLERSLITVVPMSPTGGAEAVAAKKATLFAKLGAAASSAAGKVVIATTVVAGAAAGTAAVVDAQRGAGPQTVAEASKAPVVEPEQAPHDEVVAEDPGAEELTPEPQEDVDEIALPEIAADDEPVPTEALAASEAPKRSGRAGRKARAPKTAVEDSPSQDTLSGEAKPEVSRATKLTEELAVIREAQSALRKGEYRKTLEALHRHQQKFSGGSMIQDREALRAIALCRSDDPRGQAAADSFRLRWPKSLFVPRIEKACD